MTCLQLALICSLLFFIATFYTSVASGWFLALVVFVVGSHFLLDDPIHTNINGILIGFTLLFAIAPIRRLIFARPLLAIMKRVLPPIGETERIALEAGTVWWDRDLFSGNPNWKKMLDFKIQPLSNEEKMFLDGPVQKLCTMANDWEINKQWDLPPEIWSFLKEHRFFGMIIPKKYGGLGFSAQAHSEVVSKLGSRSTSVAVTVMVPNSLGPAELLLHYGTEEQKDHYLPRLARGQEIPCFALTEPQAGSDASSIRSSGVICNGIFEGKPTVGIRLNWDKRWITLAPISTLIGLAFQLKDPEHILGNDEDIGITCALIPSHLPGIEIGKRHNTLHASFQNGPTRGTDVFVPLSYIIGGEAMAGQGWRMLMECLAAGRSISLPAMACGNSKLALRLIAAHGKVREQFNLSIGKFEGVEEKIANMAGLTYLSDASRKLTAGAVDAGEKPSVVSAIMKAYTTENARQIVNDAMDIRAGSGITLGPKNPLGPIYMATPISITVEGANILTRTLIIFGQGAIRCHPFVQKEIEAVAKKDYAGFDAAFFGHVAHVIRNGIRTLLLGLTSGRMTFTGSRCPQSRILQKLTRVSASFAFLSDVSMGVMGGSLKRKEKISGRLADILSWMYLATASVKRFKDEGERKEDVPFLMWTTHLCLYNIQRAFYGVFTNFKPGIISWVLRKMIFPLGAPFRLPNDDIGHKLTQSLFENAELRDRLTQGIYLPRDQEEGLGFLEATMDMMRDCEPLVAKIREATSRKIIDRHQLDIFQQALNSNIITASDKNKLEAMEIMKTKAIQVDEFEQDYFKLAKG
jgi:acyl-CoA dehydrogenase